jgi:hypothetical protein
MTLVSSFTALLQQVSFVMTQPTFDSFGTLVTGWVFAGRRTVTGMIVSAGAVKGGSPARRAKHHSAYHRVFAAARWSLDELGLAVFGLIRPWVGAGTIFLALDDTLARKRGLKMFGVGMHHDPLLSTRKTAIMNWGHSWVVLGVIVRLPFCPTRAYCLPILFRLYVNKQTAAKKRLAYRTRPQLAVEMLHRLCNAHEHRRFHVVADSAYGGQSVLNHLPVPCGLTSRLTLNARLYDAPPERKPGVGGRPRKRGPRLPTPKQMLQPRAARLTLNLYGRHDRSRVAETVARVHKAPERPLKVVAVEPLTGGRTMQAFYSTNSADTAEQVLTRYALRWSIEEMNQASKSHLGFEEPQGWTRRAVERTAPTAMLLYSLIVLWFAGIGHRHYRAPWRPWYTTKRHPSFADMLDTLRRMSIRQEVSSLRLCGRGSRKVLTTLLQALPRAA